MYKDDVMSNDPRDYIDAWLDCMEMHARRAVAIKRIIRGVTAKRRLFGDLIGEVRERSEDLLAELYALTYTLREEMLHLRGFGSHLTVRDYEAGQSCVDRTEYAYHDAENDYMTLLYD